MREVSWIGPSGGPGRATPGRVGTAAAETRPVDLRGRVLRQVLFCAVAPSLLLAAGKAHLAARTFWIVFLLLAFHAVVSKRRIELLCLAIGVSPFINLFRDFAFHNIVSVLFGGILLHAFVREPGETRLALRRNPLAVAMIALVTLYYVASFIVTKHYSVNLRLYDFAFAMLAILLIGRRLGPLSAALRGITVSACAVGAAMLPHVQSDAAQRLGLIALEGKSMGNPVQLGIPLALGFLAVVVDRGRWLDLERRPGLRLLLGLPTVMLLALTTSRASWLVAGAGVLLTLLFGRRQRLRTLLAIGLGLLAVQLVLLSSFGPMLRTGLERTFGEDRTASQRSSGRSDQWLVARYAFSRSFGSVLHGYGPGNGVAVYDNFSPQVEGVLFVGPAAFHSLFMQVGVETGLLGLAPLLAWLLIAGWKVLWGTRRSRTVLPLVCFVGYVLIVMTVSGNDTISGALLGIALLAATKPREAVRPAAAEGFERRLRPAQIPA